MCAQTSAPPFRAAGTRHVAEPSFPGHSHEVWLCPGSSLGVAALATHPTVRPGPGLGRQQGPVPRALRGGSASNHRQDAGTGSEH